MISAKEAAAAMQEVSNALSGKHWLLLDAENKKMGIERAHDSGLISNATYNRLLAEHDINMARAQIAQDQMNRVNQAYIEAAWAKTPPGLPPEPKRVMAWELDRDDKSELRLWWDWKQLDPDVKREMLPPPCPSERTQAFMDTNPAWKFEEDGTLVGAKKEKSEVERAFDREMDRRHRFHVALFCYAFYFMVSFGIAMVAITLWVH